MFSFPGIARRRASLLAVAIIGNGLVAAACGGGNSSPATPAAPAATATTTASSNTDQPTATAAPEVEQIDFASPSTIDGADSEFNYSALVWQGYWLSRDQFGPLAMGSGMGIPFAPPMDMIQAAMQMVAQNPADQPFVPQNLAPLQALYRSGDTALAQDMTAFAPDDFAGLRLDPPTFEEVVGVAGQAELMLKESQWTRNFHTESHFGTPESDFGAQQRFVGMMTALLAQMQGQYAMQMLMNPADGLYYDSDGALDYRGNWVLLHAFADIAGITGDPTLRYANADAHGMFAGAAGQLFQALSGREIADAPEGTSAVRALAFLAWTTDDDALRESALARLEEIAATLAAIQPDSPAAHSARIVGLLAAAQASGGPINPSVTESWEALQAAFNPATGVFDGTSTYTTDDVAWLIGGANFMLQAGPDALKAEAARTLVAFYEATLNQSGMQLSAPPGKDRAMAGPFEKDLPSVVYYHGRNTPPPPMAGGQFGRLPLPAAEVQLQNGAWAVTDTRVDSAGAMHLANELNWLGPHLGSIPFPPLRDAAASNPGGNAGAASTDITISARDIAFDTSALAAPAGQEVTLTFVNNDDAVPHNFHLSGSGGIDAKTDIFPGSDGRSRTLRFTLDRPGTYTFVCDVHRGQMSGTLTAG